MKKNFFKSVDIFLKAFPHFIIFELVKAAVKSRIRTIKISDTGFFKYIHIFSSEI